MNNPFTKVLNSVAKSFKDDPSKMLIRTGVAGWTLSSIAQIGAVLINPKISNEQKSFLIPQEFADAAVNIGLFFVLTLSAKKFVSKLFSTGKFAPKSVRKYLNEHKDLYGKKIGKLDLNLDNVLEKNKDFPSAEYRACKSLGTTIATVGAGVLASNIITPIIRNEMASNMQKKYINNSTKPLYNKPQIQTTTFKTSDIKI